MDDITRELTDLVATKFKVPPERVRLESDFIADFGADSLALVELVMALEERLGVRIEDEEAERVRTFADAVALAKTKSAA
ncbi:MAG TPA: acyl carrier protein [Candidatus Binatia bacterium]|jgi:acyl carrier protein|nr:acyl carrier protein [Candidatus Binatia bacterium]